MSEATQSYINLETSATPTNPGFQSTLDYIREAAPHLNTAKANFSSG